MGWLMVIMFLCAKHWIESGAYLVSHLGWIQTGIQTRAVSRIAGQWSHALTWMACCLICVFHSCWGLRNLEREQVKMKAVEDAGVWGAPLWIGFWAPVGRGRSWVFDRHFVRTEVDAFPIPGASWGRTGIEKGITSTVVTDDRSLQHRRGLLARAWERVSLRRLEHERCPCRAPEMQMTRGDIAGTEPSSLDKVMGLLEVA